MSGLSSRLSSAQQALMPNPASSYQTVLGMQAAPGLALTGNQQSNMANQVQGMMVPYPPMQSYQVFYSILFIQKTNVQIKSSKPNKRGFKMLDALLKPAALLLFLSSRTSSPSSCPASPPRSPACSPATACCPQTSTPP